MNRSGEIPRAASASLKNSTFSSTNAFAGRPSSTADWAMLIECSSVPVRNRVSSPFIRCQRAMTSAPITSYSVCRPGRLFA
jgi:hypothetical protein